MQKPFKEIYFFIFFTHFLFIFLNVLARLYLLDPLGQDELPNLEPVQGLSLRIPLVAFFIQLFAKILF
tara:strand:+ start:467 stop:670 length:204 start_codon:yes stop_codon:yes gene_type:complete